MAVSACVLSRFGVPVPRERHGIYRRNGSSFLKLRATSQDNSVSTSSESSEQTEAIEAGTEARTIEKNPEQEDIAQSLKELRKQQDADGKPNLWQGLTEEIGLIEWPSFSKVFGTTLVVMGIILGSSFVLLSVNFLLAELSDAIFKSPQ